jgi:hypothetical protein
MSEKFRDYTWLAGLRMGLNFIFIAMLHFLPPDMGGFLGLPVLWLIHSAVNFSGLPMGMVKNRYSPVFSRQEGDTGSVPIYPHIKEKGSGQEKYEKAPVLPAGMTWKDFSISGWQSGLKKYIAIRRQGNGEDDGGSVYERQYWEKFDEIMTYFKRKFYQRGSVKEMKRQKPARLMWDVFAGMDNESVRDLLTEEDSCAVETFGRRVPYREAGHQYRSLNGMESYPSQEELT